MAEEPTFQIGEIAYIKPGVIDSSGIDRSHMDLTIMTKRGSYVELIHNRQVLDGYAGQNRDFKILVEHESLYRKRPECDDKSKLSFQDLISKLKESTPCEQLYPSTTSEPQEASSSSSFSSKTQTREQGESPSTILADSRKRQGSFLRKVLSRLSASW